MHMQTLWRSVFWSALALWAASCGRIDYDPSAGTDGGGPGGDASATPDGAVTEPADAAPDAFTGDPDTLWWDRAWSHRIRLTIDTTTQAEDLFDIPIAVYLDQSRIDPAKAQLSGADLRFVASDNRTVLGHEIETRPTLGDTGVVGTGVVIWVHVPELKIEAGKSYIWLYYGNPAAGDAQSPEQVWSSGYVGVWHLNQPEDPRADVSGNGNALTAFGLIPSTAGKLADGLALSPNLDALPLARGVLALGANEVTGLTVEAWINPASSLGTTVIAAKSDGDIARSFELRRLADETIELLLSFDCTNTVKVNSLELVDIGRWHHVAATFDGAVMRLYYNGLLSAEAVADVPAYSGPCDSSAPFTLGALAGGKLEFDGLVDELRMSSRAHSPEWIRVQSRATFDDLIIYGPQEPQF
jgi:biopolymer transport protein ExbB